jgi:threonine/homoserine/homoserine lactone efflux protein
MHKKGFMEKYTNPQFLISWIKSLWHHFIAVVTNTKTLLEVAVIIVAAVLMAYLLARPLKKRLQRILDAQKWRDRVSGRLVQGCFYL